jgi:hypothetical protein
MFDSINKLFGPKPSSKDGPVMREPSTPSYAPQRQSHERPQTYSKVFRWRLPDGVTKEPATVELIGSFTHWQKVPMQRDSALDAWHVTIHHIPGNKTHHYMLLVDGKPAHDKNSDGLAVPTNGQEEQYQIATDRGPRVFMLFAQTK